MKIGNLPKLTLLNTFAIFHHFIIHLLIFTSSKHTKSVTYAISYLRFSYNYQGRNLSHIIVGTRKFTIMLFKGFFSFQFCHLIFTHFSCLGSINGSTSHCCKFFCIRIWSNVSICGWHVAVSCQKASTCIWGEGVWGTKEKIGIIM